MNLHIRVSKRNRQQAFAFLNRIKKDMPGLWRDVLRHAGPPPTTATGLRGFDLNGSSLGLGSSFSLSNASGVTAGDSWMSTAASFARSALSGAKDLLGAYGEYKTATTQGKIQLEQIRAQAEALKAASAPAPAPAPSSGDMPASPAGSSTPSNGLLIGVAAAAGLGLILALKR